MAFSLVQIYSSTKSENLKATTASTLARLLRHNPTLVVYVVDKFGPRLFVAGLSDPNSKVRVFVCVCLLPLFTSLSLNIALTTPDYITCARMQPSLLITIPLILACFLSTQVVTGAINMLNMALCQPDLTVRARAALSEERSLVPGLMSLLDHPLPVLRAKALVTLLLLCTRYGC